MIGVNVMEKRKQSEAEIWGIIMELNKISIYGGKK